MIDLYPYQRKEIMKGISTDDLVAELKRRGWEPREETELNGGITVGHREVLAGPIHYVDPSQPAKIFSKKRDE